MDPYSGRLLEPQTLHKHLYSHADPVNQSDPSGRFTIAGLVSGINARLTQATANVGAVFTAAATAGNRVNWAAFWRAISTLGVQAQQSFTQIVYFASTKISSSIQLLSQQAIRVPGFRNSFDGAIRIGQRVMTFEVKSSLSLNQRVITQLSRQVDGFAKVANQLQVPQVHGHLVWTWRQPSVQQLNRLLLELGPEKFNKIQFVDGVEGLLRYFAFVLGRPL